VSDREEILGRVRAALADVGDDEPVAWSPDSDDDPAARYARDGGPSGDELVALFVERCGSYRAQVTRCGAGTGEIAAAVAAACARHGVDALITPPGLESGWVPEGVRAVPDDPPLSVAGLDAGAGTLTGCAVAIAMTGTIALDGGPGQGRRALTLVPDLHVCVVGAGQIVHGVPEAVQALGDSVRAGRPVTLVSGPSATSDIELKRVEGVHGPRQLEVIVAG
jgi:L-lactate dehydrogenase complex protein LldG